MFPGRFFPPPYFAPHHFAGSGLSPGIAAGWRSHLQLIFGPGGLTGSFSGGVLPDPGDVRLGVVYDLGNLPQPKDVEFGVVYG